MNEKKRPHIHGIRIGQFNVVAIVLACLLYIALIYETICIARQYNTLQGITDEYIRCEQDAAQVREGSDYLTEQVRMYVVTTDPTYMRLYFEEAEVTRRRDLALESLLQHTNDVQLHNDLSEALRYSNQLMERETYAMKLVSTACETPDALIARAVRETELTPEDAALTPQAQIDKARTLMFDAGYQQAKKQIMGQIALFSEYVLSSSSSVRANSIQELSRLLGWQRFLLSLLFVLTLLTFLFITILIVKPLSVYIRCIKDERLFEIVGAYEFKYLAVTYNDIYELNVANEALLQKKAETDALTGLVNRGAFDDLTHLLEHSQEPIALLLVDVDNFKGINDTYGHEVGDMALQKVAEMLSQSFRSADIPARIGGDEFAVVLMQATYPHRAGVLKKVERINKVLMDPKDGLPPMTISVGGAFSQSGYSGDLFGQADRALYEVKEHGRCGCAFTDPETGVPARESSDDPLLGAIPQAPKQ